MRHHGGVAGEVPPSARGRGKPQGKTPGEAQPFTHLGVQNADQYRRILRAFARAKERFIVHLRPEDIAAELRADADDQLTEALDQLARWGNLRADRFVRQAAEDHAGYWRKGVTDPGAEAGLLDTALDKLAALGLVQNMGTVIRGRPAIARFALGEPVIRETGGASGTTTRTEPRKTSADVATTIF